MYFLDVLGAYDFFVRDALILLLLAASIYVLMHAGMFALPQVGFMAIGAYTSAILSTETGVAFTVSLVAGTAAGAVGGLLLSLALLRLDGIYLAIATIAFGEIVRVTVRNLEIAGSGRPLVGVPRTLDDLTLCGLLLIALVGLWRLGRTRFGLAIVMIREDPLTASHQGISVRQYRMALFSLAGAMAACAGSMSVHLTGFVEPGLFDFDLLVDALAAVVLGGMTMVIGPVIGAVVIFGLPEFLHSFDEYRTLINGALIVLVVALAPEGLAAIPGGVRRYLRGRHAPELEPSAATRPEKSEAPSGATPSEDDAEAESGRPAALTVRGLAKHFGGIRALDGVDLEVRAGEILGIIGPNGSGKTTLLNIVSGVYVADSGSVATSGADVGQAAGRPHLMTRRGVARTFQGIRLVEGHSVRQNVEGGAYVARSGEGLLASLLGLPRQRRAGVAVRARADRILDELGLGAEADTDVDLLPYGAQRKVEIARALMGEPALLLLDEPTAGMGPGERDEVFALVQQVRKRGVTVVVIEHDVRVMTENCDRLAVLHFGRVLVVDVPERAIESEEVIDAYIGRPA